MHRITFVATTRLPASAEEVFDWHEAPGAFERLTPSWERVRVLRHEGGTPFSLRWDLEHRDYQRGRSFTDLQTRGPFRFWRHVHRMIPDGPHACLLEDTIEYELPRGAIGRLVGGPLVQRKLRRLFAYRHAVTRRAFETQ